MKSIKNSNGYVYLVLSERLSYSLLVDTTPGNSGQFVVAYNTRLCDDGYSWQRGYYFNDIASAVQFFDAHKNTNM